MAQVLPYLEIQGIPFTEFDSYHPVRFDITKGGRNPLTGKNRLKLIAKKWKLVVGAAYMSDATYKQITDIIDQDSLNIDIKFRDKDANLVEINCYAVYDKERSKEADAMGCWSNFKLELIEN